MRCGRNFRSENTAANLVQVIQATNCSSRFGQLLQQDYAQCSIGGIKCAAPSPEDLYGSAIAGAVCFRACRQSCLRELFRSTLLSYPADFGYRANVLATSLDIN
jgi:hypothetical protein